MKKLMQYETIKITFLRHNIKRLKKLIKTLSFLLNNRIEWIEIELVKKKKKYFTNYKEIKVHYLILINYY